MRFLVLAMLLLPAATATAAGRLTLPLDGYYRPGRYMPVRVEAAEVIQGRGVMTTRIDTPAAPVVVPVLVLDENVEPSLFVQPLRPVAENERLVGVIGVSEAVLEWLFPNTTVISVQLDISQPLPGAPVAWESLDAIVCDGPLPGLDERALQALLGSGVVFAVRSPHPPDRVFPWEAQGDWQVLRHNPVGPLAAVDSSAYAPVWNWLPGMSERKRVQTVAMGVVFAIAALSASLLRSRQASLLALGGLTILTLVGLHAWGQRQPPMNSTESGVFTIVGPLAQYDLWEFQAARNAGGRAAFDWMGNTRPLVMSSEQASQQEIAVECASDGSVLRLTARLGAKQKLACMSRIVEPVTAGLRARVQPGQPHSPMQSLVRRSYLRPGIKMLGQFPSDDEQDWPSIVLEQEMPQVRP